MNSNVSKIHVGDGVLVVGQEQDEVGGGFSILETFVGSLSRFNIWSRMLEDKEISDLYNKCDEFTGNVLAWPDLIHSLVGNVQVDPSVLCSGRDGSNSKFDQRSNSRIVYSLDTQYQKIPILKTTCLEPNPITNGNIIWTSISYNSYIQYSCSSGYNMKGTSRRQCHASNEWSSTEPSCEKLQCLTLPAVYNATWTFSENYFESVANFSCDYGFKIIGNNHVVCEDDGVWRGSLGYCQEITCNMPELSDKLIYIHNESISILNVDSVMVFDCISGYNLIGSNVLKCTDKSLWDNEVPYCQPVKCIEPPILNYGFITNQSLEYYYGDVVHYNCIQNYIFRGETFITCLEDGLWDEKMQECIPITCPPIYVENAIQSSPDVLAVGAKIEIACIDGYDPIGGMELYCLGNGTWSEIIPLCTLGSCSELNVQLVPHLKIVNVNELTFGVGSKVHFSCEDDYVIKGASSIYCGKNKTWSHDMPVCENIHCIVPTLTSSELLVNYSQPKILRGSMIEFKCKPGYRISGRDSLSCLGNDLFDGHLPLCHQITCRKPEIDYGFILSDELFLEDNKTYHVECNENYFLNGTSTIKCLDNKVSPQPLPKCLPVLCEAISISNGMLISKNKSNIFSPGSKLEFKCINHYKLIGSHEAICDQFGNWRYAIFPSCVEVECPSLASNIGLITLIYNFSTSHFSQISQEVKFVIGSKIKFECDIDYILRGVDVIECTADGTWSHASPICELQIFCIPPEDDYFTIEILKGEQTIDSKYPESSQISYQCPTGYYLLGETKNLCTASGTWLHDHPSCKEIQCPLLNITEAQLDSLNTSFGTIVNIKCNTGFQPSGTIQLECLKSGFWSDAPATCMKKFCDKPNISYSNFTNLSDSVSKFSLDKIEVKCFNDYKLVGPSHIFCVDLEWKPSLPSCLPKTCQLPTIFNDTNIIINQSNSEMFQQITDFTVAINSKLTFSCHQNYKLSGRSYVLCLSNESWSHDFPSCEEIVCEPPVIENGFIASNASTNVGAILLFKCNEGFVISGEDVLQCMQDGIWNFSFPVCVFQMYADENSGIGNSTTQEINNLYLNKSDEITECFEHFECNYRPYLNIFKEENVECRFGPNGEFCGLKHVAWHVNEIWNKGMTSCRNGSNLNFSRIAGIFVNEVNFVSEECTCMFDNTEIINVLPLIAVFNVEPFCNSSNNSSLSLYQLINFIAFQNKDSLNVSQVLHYGGLETFIEMTNHYKKLLQVEYDSTKCQDDEIYVGEKMRHEKTSAEKKFHLSSLKLQCCEDQKTNETMGPFCLGGCGWNNFQPLHSFIFFPTTENDLKCHSSNSSDICTYLLYSLNEGYSSLDLQKIGCKFNSFFQNDNLNFVCNFKSIFSFQKQCIDEIEKCTEEHSNNKTSHIDRISITNLLYVSNGRLVLDEAPHIPMLCMNNKLFSVCSFLLVASNFDNNKNSCLPSYKSPPCNLTSCNSSDECCWISVGSKNLSGTFKNLSGTFKNLSCGLPTPILFGKVNFNSTSCKKLAQYACGAGYSMDGKNYSVCLENQKWSNYSGVCKKIKCENPPTPIHAYLLQKDLTAGEHSYMKCDTGYLPMGNNTLACSLDGKWILNDSFWCREIKCNSPQSIFHGQFVVHNFSLNGHVEYSCEEDYILIGNEKRTCLINSSWNGFEPRCLLKECVPLNKISNGGMNSTSFTVNSTVGYWCNEGYELEGNLHRICRRDGSWTGSQPICRGFISKII
ncbi:hypothetical protein HELRODRAFT_158375 [Helobdella robusta]|uniref:Sushi, von Willebrand factor type A, EGF and pentraxin domain-containing protein 1 n=1 Tax=Helobdella robusta TaxID=6412 RepID=T1EMQ3_HELRO|nr:hypothetical protein HELRODRAFT_158375 [Helobdella robusta]ESO11990.1 hypothetical protein HELRODRAFT_158375 [Helobdella robusta]